MATFGRFKYGLGRFLAYWKDVLSSDKGRHLPLLGLSVLLGALLVLLEAYAVSPLYSQWNLMSYDGPYFALMGNEMAYKGAAPYVDFYDIKGPYLF